MPGKWSVNVVCKCNTATGVDSMILILWMDLWSHPWSQAVPTCVFSDRGLVIFSWIGLNRVGFPKLFSCFSMFFSMKTSIQKISVEKSHIGQAGSVASQICPHVRRQIPSSCFPMLFPWSSRLSGWEKNHHSCIPKFPQVPTGITMGWYHLII